MFSESLKWMLLALGIMLVIAAAFFMLWNRDGEKIEAAVVSVFEPTPSPTPTATPTPIPTPTPEPTPTPVPEGYAEMMLTNELIEKLTVEEKIGQLLMFGLEGKDMPSDDFVKLTGKYHIGNAILLGVNMSTADSDGGFSRAAALTDAIQELAPRGIPFIISIDVEGGNVVRFHWDPWLASAKDLGDADDPADAQARFAAIGTKLMETGLNMDLAPVVDMAEDPMTSFLTTRIISNDPEVTCRIAKAIIDGLHESKCLTSAKHFPGHGGTAGDSHEMMPTIRKTKEELEAYDFISFRAAIEAGVDSVMIAHILYPELDSENLATVSPAILTGILRKEMGFDGIIISDDFRMKGLATQMSAGEGAVRFLLAGGDVVLCGPDPEKQEEICKSLLAAVEDGTLPEERIDESLRRVLHAKISACDWSGYIG